MQGFGLYSPFHACEHLIDTFEHRNDSSEHKNDTSENMNYALKDLTETFCLDVGCGSVQDSPIYSPIRPFGPGINLEKYFF